jgi:hypothetical protein
MKNYQMVANTTAQEKLTPSYGQGTLISLSISAVSFLFEVLPPVKALIICLT